MMPLKSERECASSCSVTPSYNSNRDDDGSDSDYESDHGEDRYDHLGKLMNIRWIGPGRTLPILAFDTKGFFEGDQNLKNVGVQNNLACKVTGDSQILREILTAHGFREVGMLQRRYNLAWTGRHTKPSYVKKMAYCHIINHFPGTEELTRKDKLYKNIIRMQESKGKEHFDFVPVSFKMPSEYRSLRSHYKKERGLYIVKPVSLSRGRGVFVIDNPKKISSIHVEGPGDYRHETRHKNIVSQYIPNPLIINGYKCDLRIYVTLTSFDPVVIYMYSEGLTRFATVKYDLTLNDLNDRCMHLTNYSINMENEQYVKNIDSNVENEGSKWSLGALLRYFKSQGIDTAAIMFNIEDVVIKTILSVEWKVGTACKRYLRHRHNCFELFGFDILLDDKYKPWLIEVNLSPSLGCDTPLDVKVKSNMLCDLLNLVGIRCYDPHMQNLGGCERRSLLTLLRNRLKNSYGHYYYRLCRDACHRAWGMRHSRQRLKTLLDLENNWASYTESEVKRNKAIDLLATLTAAEVEIIQKVREEDARRNGWVRIFPTSDSWDTYNIFMDFPTTNNLVLHQRLYPERHQVMTAGRSPLAGLVTPSSSVNELFFQLTGQRKDMSEKVSKAYIENLQRIRQYETPLPVVPPNKFRHKHAAQLPSTQANTNPSWSEIINTSQDFSAVTHVHKHREESPAVSNTWCQVNLDPEPGAPVEPQKLGDQVCAPVEPQKLGDQVYAPVEPQKLGDQVCAAVGPQKLGDQVYAPVEPQKLGDQVCAPVEPQKLGDQVCAAVGPQKLGDQVYAPVEPQKLGDQVCAAVGPQKLGDQVCAPVEPQKLGDQVCAPVGPQKLGDQVCAAVEPQKLGDQVCAAVGPQKLGDQVYAPVEPQKLGDQVCAAVGPQKLGDQVCAAVGPQKLGDQVCAAVGPQQLGDQVCAAVGPQKLGDQVCAAVGPQKLGDQVCAAVKPQKLGDQVCAAVGPQQLGDQVCAPTEKNCSVTELLNNGYVLSHSQARHVFTMYLLQLHKMLLMDYGDGVDQEKVDHLSHLMLLVTQFLKQCVQYLMMPLHLQLSGHFTSVTDRRIHLAKLLFKFIQLYVEETNAQKAAGDQMSNDESILSNDKFEQYIYKADVKELERLLTAYSEHHDPVITFLGHHMKGAERTQLR